MRTAFLGNQNTKSLRALFKLFMRVARMQTYTALHPTYSIIGDRECPNLMAYIWGKCKKDPRYLRLPCDLRAERKKSFLCQNSLVKVEERTYSKPRERSMRPVKFCQFSLYTQWGSYSICYFTSLHSNIIPYRETRFLYTVFQISMKVKVFPKAAFKEWWNWIEFLQMTLNLRSSRKFHLQISQLWAAH